MSDEGDDMQLSKTIKAMLFGIALCVPVTGFAAVDMFLEIEGVRGESQDDKKKGAIDVLAWSWGASSNTTGRRTQCNIQDLSVTKWVDAASPDLLMGQLDGRVYPSATLTVRKAGGVTRDAAIEYIVIEFFDVRVTSVSTGGSGGEDRLTENTSFNFSSATYSYTPQNPDGSAGGVRQAHIAGC
jgi:type VI secretion system secreted protein Hcp